MRDNYFSSRTVDGNGGRIICQRRLSIGASSVFNHQLSNYRSCTPCNLITNTKAPGPLFCSDAASFIANMARDVKGKAWTMDRSAISFGS